MPICNLRALAQQTGLPLLEVRLLAEHATGISRAGWMSEPDRDIPVERQHELDVLLARRATGEPIAYLLGSAEFYGRPFGVTPDVLIPRPETEEVVEAVLAYLSAIQTGGNAGTPETRCDLSRLQPINPESKVRPIETGETGETGKASNAAVSAVAAKKMLRVLDVGTGSGVIAITLALEYPTLQVHACDISQAALNIAQSNARALKAQVSFRQSDWLSAFPPDEPFDLIVSNPPYIMAGDRHLEQGDLRFEPVGALTDHADGLTAYTALASACRTHLKPGGSLWVEHGWHQQTDIIRIFEQSGLRDVTGHRDLSGNARMVRAFKPTD